MQNDLISRSELANFAYHATDNMDVERCVVDWEDIEDAPAVDAVSRSVFEQVQWERDVAMQQLKDHGIPFGGTAPDAVEVVRCKDCVFYNFGECGNYRMDVSDGAHFYPYPDDFCSYGERRDDDGS